MKSDERDYLLALCVEAAKPLLERKMPYEVSHCLGIPLKRAAYICEKWCRKGWYDYGVSVGMGWLETPGIEAARGLESEGA